MEVERVGGGGAGGVGFEIGVGGVNHASIIGSGIIQLLVGGGEFFLRTWAGGATGEEKPYGDRAGENSNPAKSAFDSIFSASHPCLPGDRINLGLRLDF